MAPTHSTQEGKGAAARQILKYPGGFEQKIAESKKLTTCSSPGCLLINGFSFFS